MKKTDWKAKAEKFLGSYADPASELLHEEAVVYFLSRGFNCDQAINKIISNWKNKIQAEGELYRTKNISPIYPITIWRMVEWAKIGQLERYSKVTPDISRFKNNNLMRCCSELDFNSPFFLFWSNIGIQLFNKKLNNVLFYLQEIFENGVQKYVNNRLLQQGYKFYPPLEQKKAMIAASYIFGRYRSQWNAVDDRILSSSIQYLLESQASDGSWWADAKASAGNVVLTATIIHALSLSRPFGVERHIEHAKNFLIQIQNPNGSWPYTDNFDPDFKAINPDYTTVLVLDALELAEGGNKLTFTSNIQTDPDEENSGGIATKTDDLSINEKTQTIFYQGNKILIGGGGATWNLFVLLYEKRGEIVDIKDLRKSIGIHDINKIKYDLCRVLKKNGAEELSKKIKNSHTTGYYLEI